MGWKGGLFVALGLGAALVSGAGIAHADSSGTGSSPGRPSHSAQSGGHSRPAAVRTPKKPTPPQPSEPSGLAGPAPRPPAQATVAPETRPAPDESTATPYGVVGKWMLGHSGKPAGWPSSTYPVTTVYQPIHVIVVDPTSSTAAESVQKINAALTAAGFPPQPIHSTGYQGVIDGVAYGQQPTGPQEAFSNAHWLLVNDHGRLFGPSPLPAGTGFVWTASFSREQAGLYFLTPAHIYVSFTRARTALRDALVADGAVDLGLVNMDNKLSGRTITTGDHDGYAVVISLG